jgi:hypothetical protein
MIVSSCWWLWYACRAISYIDTDDSSRSQPGSAAAHFESASSASPAEGGRSHAARSLWGGAAGGAAGERGALAPRGAQRLPRCWAEASAVWLGPLRRQPLSERQRAGQARAACRAPCCRQTCRRRSACLARMGRCRCACWLHHAPSAHTLQCWSRTTSEAMWAVASMLHSTAYALAASAALNCGGERTGRSAWVRRRQRRWRRGACSACKGAHDAGARRRRPGARTQARISPLRSAHTSAGAASSA